MSPANLFTVTCHTKWSRSGLDCGALHCTRPLPVPVPAGQLPGPGWPVLPAQKVKTVNLPTIFTTNHAGVPVQYQIYPCTRGTSCTILNTDYDLPRRYSGRNSTNHFQSFKFVVFCSQTIVSWMDAF